MSEIKMVKRVKVILKGAKTYTLAGRKFVKDVPVIIKGSLVAEFKSNGYFKIIEMAPKEVKKKVSKSFHGDAPAKKKNKKKSSSKKKTKK